MFVEVWFRTFYVKGLFDTYLKITLTTIYNFEQITGKFSVTKFKQSEHRLNSHIIAVADTSANLTHQ